MVAASKKGLKVEAQELLPVLAERISEAMVRL
jgi:hypothetical protein